MILYHGTYEDRLDAIRREGLHAGMEGGVFFLDSRDAVIDLMGWRLATRVEGFKPYTLPTGQVVDMPDVKTFDYFYVLEVEVDESKVEDFYDPMPSLFHNGPVGPEQIRGWTKVRTG